MPDACLVFVERSVIFDSRTGHIYVTIPLFRRRQMDQRGRFDFGASREDKESPNFTHAHTCARD